MAEPNIARLTPALAVAPQLRREDFARLRAAGFRAVINNRPDGEEGGGYLTADEAAVAAAEQGLAYLHFPVTRPDLADEAFVAAFRDALKEMPTPALAYCRSGTRSTLVWALASAGERAVEDIVASAAQAGYDVSDLRPALIARAANTTSSGERT